MMVKNGRLSANEAVEHVADHLDMVNKLCIINMLTDIILKEMME